MPSNSIASSRLLSERPFFVDLCLTATAFFLWFLADCYQTKLAFYPTEYRLLTGPLRWIPQWPLGPWLLTTVGLLLAYVRWRYFKADLQWHLNQIIYIILALLVLRFSLLWSPVADFFPYLAILWAPHTAWALALLVLLFPHIPRTTDNPPRRHTLLIAASLFVAGTLVYGSYTLYFCQITMLHGDEGHYLQLTQSLLRDGDMDLSNNTGLENVQEYHVVDIGMHKAPISPPDKIYSAHPIGLSALLVPAYWLGKEWWEYPRLACALLIAVLAAGCIALTFVWLIRLGVHLFPALFCVSAAALTTPLHLYSNQLYPEIPALFICLVVLACLAHWQRPGGGYRSFGRGEPILLGLLTLLLGTTPFVETLPSLSCHYTQ